MILITIFAYLLTAVQFGKRGLPMRTIRLALCLLTVLLLLVCAGGGAVPVQAQQTSQQTHVVQAGETLFHIALTYGVTVESLVTANGLADPSHIEVGQILII